MALASAQVEFIPTHALDPGDDADGLLLRLQDRPLLDVQLQIGGELDGAGLRFAPPTDRVERGPETDAVKICNRIGRRAAINAGEDPRAEHGGGKAGPLL